MKITSAQLCSIIKEEVAKALNESLMGDNYMSADDAEQFIASMDGDAIAEQDIVDEETGEVYLESGKEFRTSTWHPDYIGAKAADDEFPEEEPLNDHQSAYDEADAAWQTAKEQFASQYVDFAEESHDIQPEDAASDLADNFFWEHPEWKQWSSVLRMSKKEMKEILADEVYNAMTIG